MTAFFVAKAAPTEFTSHMGANLLANFSRNDRPKALRSYIWSHVKGPFGWSGLTDQEFDAVCGTPSPYSGGSTHAHEGFWVPRLTGWKRKI